MYAYIAYIASSQTALHSVFNPNALALAWQKKIFLIFQVIKVSKEPDNMKHPVCVR